LPVARYKLVTGRRISSATLVADARHSWLDALSSLGALAGLAAVAAGLRWGDPVAGIAVTAFICHVGYEVTADVVRRLADGVDPAVITSAEAAAGSVDGVVHAHARARWTGRTLRVESRAGLIPGSRSAPPTLSASRSPTLLPATCPKQAASPGQRAPPQPEPVWAKPHGVAGQDTARSVLRERARQPTLADPCDRRSPLGDWLQYIARLKTCRTSMV
jgi:hypothetical protein